MKPSTFFLKVWMSETINNGVRDKLLDLLTKTLATDVLTVNVIQAVIHIYK